MINVDGIKKLLDHNSDVNFKFQENCVKIRVRVGTKKKSKLISWNEFKFFDNDTIEFYVRYMMSELAQ